jgi:RecA-family ATPase
MTTKDPVLKAAQAKVDARLGRHHVHVGASTYPLVGAEDFDKLPRLTWRIKPVLPATGLAAVIGVSGAGKSFITLDMTATLTAGGRWFGYRVKACRVVYAALEGAEGLRRRVECVFRRT